MAGATKPLPAIRMPPLRMPAEQPESTAVNTRKLFRRDAIYRRGLAVADVLSAAFATFAAVILVGDDSLRIWSLCAFPLVVLLSKIAGLYDRDEMLLRKSTLEEVPALFGVATLYALLFWLLGAVLVDGSIGRDQLLVIWGVLLVGMVLTRAGSRRVARATNPAERCLVVGDRQSAERLNLKLDLSRSIKAKVVGRVPFRYGNRRGEDRPHNKTQGDIPILGELQDIGQVLVRHEIDRVIVAPEISDAEYALDVIRLVEFFDVKVSLLPRLFEVIGSSAALDDVDGLTLLGIRRFGLPRSSAFLKRSMDLAGSILAILVLSPFLLPVALAIKATSAGPVFFRQRRIGRDGRGFWILKFRTMFVDAEQRKTELAHLNEADGLFKISDDPRITRVGGFLRGASLDELPQLINVLRGKMSLVGPRPLVPDDDRRIEGCNRRRLHVNPGMTGHWQILGASRVPLREMIKIDYLYEANWSLWGDIKILLRTGSVVVGREGI